MSTEENKALVRRWVDLWNTQNVAAVGELIAPTYVRHDPNSPEVHGVEGEQQFMTTALTAFPDLNFTIDDLFGEGDRIAGRYILRGTQRGEWLGIPPTNKAITVEMLEVYRIADGKIAEQWVVLDALGMLQQLGVVPTPGQ